jgi:DNA-binding protein H-NS
MSESDSAKLAAAAWVREQMDRYALTLDDLVAAGCFDKPAPAAAPAVKDGAAPRATNGRVLYRNALGQSWDGTGEYPDWLQRAVNAGQSIDFYRVE